MSEKPFVAIHAAHRARRLCPSMYHAGYLEADEQHRADNQDSDRAQRPPDERKSIPVSIGWAMVQAIGMMGCHDDLLRLPKWRWRGRNVC